MKSIKYLISIVFLAIIVFFLLYLLQPITNPFTKYNFTNVKIYLDTIENRSCFILYFQSDDLEKVIKKTNSCEYISFYYPLNNKLNNFKKLHNDGQYDIIGRYLEATYYLNNTSFSKKQKLRNGLYEYKIELILEPLGYLSQPATLKDVLNNIKKENRNIIFYGYITHNPFSSIYDAAWSKPIIVNEIIIQ